ncbi:hypothetical protein [Achromobacter insuavis]
MFLTKRVSQRADKICHFSRQWQQQHTAFVAEIRADVDAFHAAAMNAGGADNGVPGLRNTNKGHPPGYCAALVLDPDGNNI